MNASIEISQAVNVPGDLNSVSFIEKNSKRSRFKRLELCAILYNAHPKTFTVHGRVHTKAKDKKDIIWIEDIDRTLESLRH